MCGRMILVLVWLAGMAEAQGASLFAGETRRAALVPMGAAAAPRDGGPSLFAGIDGAGLFAPRAPPPPAARALPRLGGTELERLFALIASVEAGQAGYDAVQHGAVRLPPAPPTRMTIGEIMSWIAATPGQPHAIGRYQVIPATLRRLVTRMGLAPDARFSPALQDRMATILVREAGYARFRAGQIDRVQFMNNLARVWAGLPNSSGRSHYHGHAGNRAGMSWARFDREMGNIFPETRG